MKKPVFFSGLFCAGSITLMVAVVAGSAQTDNLFGSGCGQGNGNLCQTTTTTTCNTERVCTTTTYYYYYF